MCDVCGVRNATGRYRCTLGCDWDACGVCMQGTSTSLAILGTEGAAGIETDVIDLMFDRISVLSSSQSPPAPPAVMSSPGRNRAGFPTRWGEGDFKDRMDCSRVLGLAAIPGSSPTHRSHRDS